MHKDKWSFDVESLYDKIAATEAGSKVSLSKPVNVYFENYYPNAVPPFEIHWIVSSVLNSPDNDQSLWWHLIGRWVNETKEHHSWRQAVYEALKSEASKQDSFEKRIEEAMKIFAGSGMRLIAAQN